MELLNFSFAKLLIQLSIVVLPGVLGIYFIAASEDSKREIRRRVCSTLFSAPNAFTYKGFARFMVIAGSLLVLLSIALAVVLVVLPQLSKQ